MFDNVDPCQNSQAHFIGSLLLSVSPICVCDTISIYFNFCSPATQIYRALYSSEGTSGEYYRGIDVTINKLGGLV
jgi:hypothetical protein